MNDNFNNVKPLWYWVQHVLPLVYDDSLSYMELLAKVTKKLNELIENNNKLPDYIMELIKEYISSGEIEKVLAEVLANYMLNVKFPPAGLTPATGDGSADDTEAIQGCIDYAFNNGGMAVYFPSGSYLTKPLTLRNKATLFGQDRYTTRLVMKGGATTAMFTGDVDELTLTGLGFDGNMDIQVNNVNLFDITVNSAFISNCLLTDGYELLNITVNNDLQLSNLLFRHAVEDALVLNGAGIVQGDNLIFKSVSTLVGKNFVVMGVSKSILEQVKCFGASPNGVLITGDNNVVKMWNEQSLTPYVDNGTNNSITVYTQSEVEKLTGNKTDIIGGNATETITGNKDVSAHDITETATGTRTENTTGNRNETTGGNATEIITGNKDVAAHDITEEATGTRTEDTTGNRNETTGGNATETIAGNKDVSAHDITETATGARTENTTGNRKETTGGNATETIDGNKEVRAANITETIDGVKTVNAGNISNTAENITNHTTRDLTEQVDGVRTLTVTGANNETTGARTETVNGNKIINIHGLENKTIDDEKKLTAKRINTNITENVTEVVGGTVSKSAHALDETYNTGTKTINGDLLTNVKGTNTENNGNKNVTAFTENHSVTNYDVTADDHIAFSTRALRHGGAIEELQNGVKGIKGYELIDGSKAYGVVTWIDPALLGTQPNDYVTPEQYGAKGDGVTDDTVAIQNAINSRKAVIFTHGKTYLLGSELQLLSGTYIDGRGAILKASDSFQSYTNFMMARNDGYDSTIGGYEQNADITIKNLTFNANLRPLVGGIGIGHAHNVLIQGCEFYNWASWHPIELNSTLNGVVTDCYFHDMPKDGEEYGECLQIDIAYDASVFNLSPYDNTPCRNILICNNRFELNPALQNKYNVQPACIGSHTTDGTNSIEHMSSNIIVTDNVAYGAQTFCLATNWRNSLIANNIASNIRCGVYSNSWDRLTIIGNEFYFIIAEDVDGYNNRGIYTNAENNLVHGNVSVINNILERTLSHGISLSGDVVTIQGNVLKYPNYHGIYASWNAGFTSVIGNTVTGESETYYGIYVNPNSNTTPITYVNGNSCEKLNAVGVSKATEKSVIANNIIRKSATINSVFVRTGNIVNGEVDT